jgi:uncharacterized BrkB/YihY/UPF0761 family membrane protein
MNSILDISVAAYYIIISLATLGSFVIALYGTVLRPRREKRRIAWREINNELNKLQKLIEEVELLGSIPSEG